jgi:hypothetical protein
MNSWEKVTLGLEKNFDRFLRGWGPIDWREEVAAMNEEPIPRLGRLFWALAGIEDDSRQMRVKLHWSGADRSTVIQDFNVVWLAEEAEHSRAFLAIASKLGCSSPLPSHRTLHRDRRSVITAGTLRAGSLYRAGILAAYLTLGTLQEFVALSTYNAIGRDPRTPAAIKPVLRSIAGQEGRHMRFYRQGAITVFDSFPKAKPFVRAVARHSWRPPGVDLLGKKEWADMFIPVLQSRDGAAIFDVDRIASQLLGDRMALMKTFEGRLSTLSPGNASGTDRLMPLPAPREASATPKALQSRIAL